MIPRMDTMSATSSMAGWTGMGRLLLTPTDVPGPLLGYRVRGAYNHDQCLSPFPERWPAFARTARYTARRTEDASGLWPGSSFGYECPHGYRATYLKAV